MRHPRNEARVFTDGELNQFFETEQEILWATGRVHIQGDTIFLHDLIIYPASGTHADVGAPAMFLIVRALKDEALAQGLARYSLHAVRMYPNKPRRMISINRSLR